MKILDCQIDMGRNLFGPDSDLEIYLKEAPAAIKEAIVLPTGTHILKSGETIETSCIWEADTIIRFYSIMEQCGKKKRVCFPRNPYLSMNRHVLRCIRQANKKQKDRKFYFAPKYHPRLDTELALEEFINESETVAIKIQGISSFCSPFDIPNWFIKKLKDAGLPLMVHTDYSPNDSMHRPQMQYIQNLNTALNWVVFALTEDIRVYLAHGAKLSLHSAQLINKYDNFLVGTGPDYMLDKEQDMLCLHGPYLRNLFNQFDPNKIAFNTDFAWNAKKRTNWNDRDWKSIGRIKGIMQKQGLIRYTPNVFNENAKRFFNIP